VTTNTTTETTTAVTRTVDGAELPLSGTYGLDVSHTEVGFAAKHLMVSKVRGRFTDFSGTVVIGDDPADSSVDVEIAAASITSRDDKRDEHLRSPDFLDVEQFPTVTYRSSAVRPASRGHWLVDGELTIHGVTRPVQLDVEFEGASRSPWNTVAVGFSAEAKIDREDFGLTWNQALETGGVLVGKQVTIHIEAELSPAS
jgi:polyisoprenoid-binding protein YceI